MAASIPSLMNDGGIALQLLQQAAEARDAARSGKPLRGYDSNNSSKASDSVEALGRIIEDIDDTKEVRFKTPLHWQQSGLPAEVTDLRALASELNRRQHEGAVFNAQARIEEAKRRLEYAQDNVAYAEEDYQMSNGELDGRADAAKGVEEAKHGLVEAQDWLKALKDPTYDPDKYALHESSKIRAFVIVGDRIAGTITNGGHVGSSTETTIPGYNGTAFATSIGIPWKADSDERANAVIEALTKLLGKNGLVVDVG